MTIKIIEEPKISLSQAQYERLFREYENCMMFTTNPCSFEVWYRQHKEVEGMAS